MIQLQHVYKSYPGGTHALKNIDLTIDKGEFVYLTGRSGAGKTTLFRLISAFDHPSSGKLNVANFNLTEISSGQVPYFRRRIGVVYQDFKLLRSRTVFENVRLPLEVLGHMNGIDEKVHRALDEVSLLDKKHQFPEQLSGGEQQRVAIARALIHDPGLLIADEPTGNLDPTLTEEIMDLFDKANARGTTVFIATHDHELVQRRSHRRIHLSAGQIEQDILESGGL